MKVMKIYLYVFFSEFYNFSCNIRSLSHFELIFVYGVKLRTNFIYLFFFACDYPIVSALFAGNIILSSLNCLNVLVEKQLT